MRTGLLGKIIAAAAIMVAPPAYADSDTQAFESAFDRTLGTEIRQPQAASGSLVARYDTDLTRQIAQLAEASRGRIGVYAIDLTTGREVGVMADQRFPMASTSKVAIAATYLAGVDAGKWSLTSEWQLPRPGGAYMPASRHINLMISKSCNDCTDAMLSAVGGPSAVNAWMRQAGIEGFTLSRDIRTLIREDGRSDPAWSVDVRDSATPRAMGRLLAGIYQGRWLSDNSRRVLVDAMLETTTGKKRMRSVLPMSAMLANKTGTLSRTASDIGIFHTPDGRAIAAAIYVTGQSLSMAVENGSRAQKLEARRLRDARISTITDALYRGFGRAANDNRAHASAEYGGE